jgi:hypothetical protein
MGLWIALALLLVLGPVAWRWGVDSRDGGTGGHEQQPAGRSGTQRAQAHQARAGAKSSIPTTTGVVIANLDLSESAGS